MSLQQQTRLSLARHRLTQRQRQLSLIVRPAAEVGVSAWQKKPVVHFTPNPIVRIRPDAELAQQAA